jgi:hypothetical protein
MTWERLQGLDICIAVSTAISTLRFSMQMTYARL